MSHDEPSTWLPRLLFLLTTAAAAGLIGLVLLAPLLKREGTATPGWPRVVEVFAEDATLRRTAVASGAGLLVTACVFFRTAPDGSRGRSKKPPRPDVVGA